MLAVADNLVLVFEGSRLLFFGYAGSSLDVYLRCITPVVLPILFEYPAWPVVFTALDRYRQLTTLLPGNPKLYLKRAQTICAMLACLLFVLNVPFAGFFEVVQNSGLAQCHPNPFYIVRVWMACLAVVYCYTPLLLIVVLNTRIIVSLYRAHAQSARVAPSWSTRTPTIMLISIMAAFILTTVPLVSYTAVGSKALDSAHPFSASMCACQFLLLLNHSCNFFLYCASAAVFRSECWDMIKSCIYFNEASTASTCDQQDKMMRRI